MAFPLRLDEYLYAVAKETARLSWPGRMWPILRKGAKNNAEKYFTSDAFLTELREVWQGRVRAYDSWHEERVFELAASIAEKVTTRNAQGIRYRPETVAAKLLDTFMHQLVKYPECRFLWADLHLVLDNRVFAVLHTLARDSVALRVVDDILTQNPYTISGEQYKHVQTQLREFVEELKSRPGQGFDLGSRIQLNILWADGHRNGRCANHA
jgi:prepilin-type processing-associated H-X9-DG protein